MARSLTQNLVANLVGRAWSSVLSLLFVPIYVRFMGIEAYGLIGVFLSVTALLSVLDLGLSPTLSRELARLSAGDAAASARESRDLVRTGEVVFWVAGLVVGGTWALAAPTLGARWVSAAALSPETVARAFSLMGLVVAVQWPAAMYDGGLTGLQRLLRLNLVRIVFGTVQNVGAALALWLVSPSLLVYFGWQIVSAVGLTLALRQSLWAALPGGPRAAFRPGLLRKHARFAAGMTGITITSIVLTQTDKLLLSRLVPLEIFGYYVLAASVAYALTYIVTPIFTALFPRFSQVLAGPPDDSALAALYHRSAQTVAALVLPAAAVLILFTEDLLFLWTRDPAIVRQAAALTRLLAVGSCLNAIMFLPYLLQVSSGWTRLAFLKNIVAIAALVPLLFWGASRYGAVAGAVAWISLNAAYLLFEVPIMHRRLLRTEMWAWYRGDVAIPSLVSLAVAGISRALMPPALPPPASASWIVATGAATLAAAAAAMPSTRAWLAAQRARRP